MIKKTFLIVLAMLITITMTVGCTQEKPNANQDQAPSDTNFSEEKLGTYPVQENVTGELNIHRITASAEGVHWDQAQRLAEQMFQEKFPNVKLNVELIDIENGGDILEQYYTRLKAEIMSGKSPDVLLINSNFTDHSDLYKLQDAGAFLDLSEFMEGNENINFNDYNLNVINAAKFKDKQYIMPFSYTTKYYASTEEILKEVGVDIKNLQTSFGVFKEANSYWKRYKDIPDAKTFLHQQTIDTDLNKYMGIPVVDYQNEQTDLDNPDFKKLIELWKGIYLNEKRVDDPMESSIYSGGLENIMKNKKGIGQLDSAGMLEFFTIDSILQNYGTPAVTTLRDANNKIQAQFKNGVAISNNSKNKENAWRFIECMLSKECQSPPPGDILAGTPVLKTVWEPTFEQLYENGYKKSISFEVEADYPAVSREVFDKWVKEQEKISGLYFRTQMDYEVLLGVNPYWRGEKTYDECIESIRKIMEIYVSE